MQPKKLMSADVGIGHQFKIDIKFWSPNVATEI